MGIAYKILELVVWTCLLAILTVISLIMLALLLLLLVWVLSSLIAAL